MAADAAETAARVPSAVFRTILDRLHGVSYTDGAKATSTVTFTIVDAAPHLIPAGSEIDVDGYAFVVEDDVPTSSTSVPAIPVVAAETGAEFNDLRGDNVIAISALSFVENVVLDVPTAGGSDPEDDQAFQSRGSRELELMAKTLVTARDYELLALSRPAVDRVVAVPDTVQREIVVTSASSAGAAIPQPEKDALAAIYDGLRLSNWQVVLGDPVVTAISVDYAVHPYPDYDGPDLIARVNGTLDVFLDPGNWGRSGGGFGDESERRWLLEPTVRFFKLIDVIGSVDGVDWVDSMSISGAAGSLQGNDWLMPGDVPLASPGTFTGSIV